MHKHEGNIFYKFNILNQLFIPLTVHIKSDC